MFFFLNTQIFLVLFESKLIYCKYIQFLSEINAYSVLDPTCSDQPPSTNEMPVTIRSLKENPEEFITSPSSSVADISCIVKFFTSPYFYAAAKLKWFIITNLKKGIVQTGDLLANYWGNHHLVREALHVKEVCKWIITISPLWWIQMSETLWIICMKGTIKRFLRCDFDVNSYHYTRSIPSSVPYHFNLITRGFRALIYR